MSMLLGVTIEERQKRVAERRKRVAELYPDLTAVKIGSLLGVSDATVLCDLEALGIERRPAGARKRYEPAQPKACQCCGELFTPRDDRTDARFCSSACSDRGRRTTPAASFLTRQERIERSATLYLSGMSYVEIAQLLGVTAMTCRADVLAAGIKSRPAIRRRSRYKGGWTTCKCGCGRRRWEYDSNRHEFLGTDCWARYRWRHGIALEPLLADCKSRGKFPPAARQRWYGRWKLVEVGQAARSAKGRDEALAVGRRALALVEKHPKVASDRLVRRAIIERLMSEFIGPVTNQSTSDPDYQRARVAIKRRLRRAHRELGCPTQLSALL